MESCPQWGTSVILFVIFINNIYVNIISTCSKFSDDRKAARVTIIVSGFQKHCYYNTLRVVCNMCVYCPDPDNVYALYIAIPTTIDRQIDLSTFNPHPSIGNSDPLTYG